MALFSSFPSSTLIPYQHYCRRCQTRVYPESQTTECPLCNSYSVDVTPELMEPGDPRLHFTPDRERSRLIIGGINSVPEDHPDVSNVIDRLGQIQLQDDSTNNNSILLPRVISVMPPDYTADDAAVDSFQWDRILTWFFENEGLYVSASGLPEEEIESIPVSLLKAKDIEKEPTCSICIDDFELREEVKNLPCKHFFHKECISSWLKMRANCPVCRQTVKVDSVRKETSSTSSGESRDGDEHDCPSNEVLHSYSAHPLPGGNTAVNYSGITMHNIDIPEDGRISRDAYSSSWHFNGAAPYTSAIQPGEEWFSQSHTTQHAEPRNYSGLDDTESHQLSFPFQDRYFEDEVFSPPDGHVSYSDHSIQIPENAIDYTLRPLQDYLRGTITGLFSDNSHSGHHFSNSSSSEDLSTVVPVLPPNIVF